MATTAQHTTEMAMKVRLSQQARERLAKRAQESGCDIDAVVSELVEQAITQPSLDELLTVSQSEFASTGITPDEMMDFGRELLDKVRNEKAPRP